jgi:GT2 family glycosyltransferase
VAADELVERPSRLLCICVATHKRPIGLSRLLHALALQRGERVAATRVQIVVVDNDPDGSAAEPCAVCGAASRWPIEYVRELRKGIPFARNTSVRTVRRLGGELIAFIDDDEVPEVNWLEELLAVLNDYGADVVAGPVPPVFEEPVPEWMRRGRFFDSPIRPTGTRLDRAGTGNVLLRTGVFDQVAGMFDETLDGGSDTDFFLRASHAGCSIVWSDSAVAHTVIPKSRARAVWLLRKEYKAGDCWGRFRHDLQPPPTRALLKGIVLLPVSLVRGRHAIVESLQLIALACGYFAAKAGFHFDAYQVTDGR